MLKMRTCGPPPAPAPVTSSGAPSVWAARAERTALGASAAKPARTAVTSTTVRALRITSSFRRTAIYPRSTFSELSRAERVVVYVQRGGGPGTQAVVDGADVTSVDVVAL